MLIRDSQFRPAACGRKVFFKKKTRGSKLGKGRHSSMRNEKFGYNPSIAHLEELDAIREILEKTQTTMVGIGFLNCLLLLIILLKARF